MIRRALHEWVLDNPMMRWVKIFLTGRMGPGTQFRTAHAMLLCYPVFALLLAFTRFTGVAAEQGLLYVHFVLCLVLPPFVFFDSIAKEREIQTWDLLVAAPITKPQLVAGKVVCAAAYSAICFCLAFVCFRLLNALPVQPDTENQTPLSFVDATGTMILASSFMFAFSTAIIFISGRVAKALNALVVGLVCSIFMGVVFLVNASYQNPVPFLNPFAALPYAVENLLVEDRPFMPLAILNIIGILTYITVGFLFSIWIAKTAHFADNTIKFLPKKKIYDEAMLTITHPSNADEELEQRA